MAYFSRVGDLNSFLAREGGNLNTNFQKIQMPGTFPGGMLKLRFDWYIIPHKKLTNSKLGIQFKCMLLCK